MNNICPVSGTPLKVVNAGVSKTTGKPYASFVACEVKYCKGPHIMDATFQPHPKLPAVPQTQQNAPQEPKPDWDNIAIGKTMSLFLEAYIASGHSFEEAQAQIHNARALAEAVVNYRSELDDIANNTPF